MYDNAYVDDDYGMTFDGEGDYAEVDAQENLRWMTNDALTLEGSGNQSLAACPLCRKKRLRMRAFMLVCCGRRRALTLGSLLCSLEYWAPWTLLVPKL